MIYNLCAVIPINSDNLEDIKSKINRVIKLNCRFIEFRFDYINEIEKITHNLLYVIKKQASPKLSSIFTFRDRSEGGILEIRREMKLALIKKLFYARPNFIDIEMMADNEILELVKEYSSENDVNLIFSYHDFQKTMNLPESIDFLNLFEQKLKDLSYNKSKISDSVYKIVYTANIFQDNFIPLQLCKFYSGKDKRIISFCMGDLGIISRIMCIKAGSLLSYATLDKIVAPGQIKIEDFKTIINLLEIN